MKNKLLNTKIKLFIILLFITSNTLANSYTWLPVASVSDLYSIYDKETTKDKIFYGIATYSVINKNKVNLFYDQNNNEVFYQKEIHPSFNDYFGHNNDTKPISSVIINNNDKKRQKKIAITFDSAYINRYTYQILNILDEYNIKCTFFVTGDFISNNPEQIKDILRMGHEIGNHTTKHTKISEMYTQSAINDINICHKNMKDLTGIDMCLFRFPYGSYSERTIKLVKGLGYYPIQWTIDSQDWKNDGKESIIHRVLSQDTLLTEGAIILFHNGAIYTPYCLPRILDVLIKEKGLIPCKVSDLIYEKDFNIQNGSKQSLNTN